MRRLVLLLGMAAACGFHPTGLEPSDGDAAVDAAAIDAPDPGDGPEAIDAAIIDAADLDAAVPIDAAIDAPTPIDAPTDAPTTVGDDIIHVRTVDEVIGTGDLTVSTTLTISTSGTPSASAPLPTGVTLAVVPQDGGGSDLVLLRVQNLTVSGAIIATGTRPLVILAENATISGWIDVAAAGPTAGAGALTTGTGAGGTGGHVSTFSDGGGGGASFGGNGADGGDAPCMNDCQPDATAQGGTRGAIYGSPNLDVLQGGSPGGRSYRPTTTTCPMGNPGSGGGAIQVYAHAAITIGAGGGITAGGGGGDGGYQCGTPYNWLAGHGGGAGGAIYLQAGSIANGGLLVANGGGGGGGAGQNGNGANGGSAGRTTAVGGGGNGNGAFSARGGDGARQGNAAQAGGNGPDQGNGGGGGGGVGRIHLRAHTPGGAGTVSPTATTSTY